MVIDLPKSANRWMPQFPHASQWLMSVRLCSKWHIRAQQSSEEWGMSSEASDVSTGLESVYCSRSLKVTSAFSVTRYSSIPVNSSHWSHSSSLPKTLMRGKTVWFEMFEVCCYYFWKWFFLNITPWGHWNICLLQICNSSVACQSVKSIYRHFHKLLLIFINFIAIHKGLMFCWMSCCNIVDIFYLHWQH